MPRIKPTLTAKQVAALSKKPGSHFVGGCTGLYLRTSMTVDGGHTSSWVLRYGSGAARQELGLGSFRDVTLAEAREEGMKKRRELQSGRDPRAEKAARREAAKTATLSYKDAAEQVYRIQHAEKKSPKALKNWWQRQEKYVFPVIGGVAVGDVELSQVLGILQPIWMEKNETATRVRYAIERVLSWATVHGHRTGDNPARWKNHLSELLPSPEKVAKTKHHRSIHWSKMANAMPLIVAGKGMGPLCLRWMIFNVTRGIESRQAEWSEIDLEEAVWNIPAEKTKLKRDHRVPLSAHAIELLQEIPRTDSPYLFWGKGGGFISNRTHGRVLAKHNIDATPHGFRTTFRVWYLETDASSRYEERVSKVVMQHQVGDATDRAYAQSDLLEKRRLLMQEWGDFVASQC